MFDAVIIGCSVVGAMTARTLTSYGMIVCIIKKERIGCCKNSKMSKLKYF